MSLVVYKGKNFDEDAEEVREASSSPSSFMADGRRKFRGLSNQGATCYMNSLLQTLYMTPEFRRGIYQWVPDTDDSSHEDSIPLQLQKLFALLQFSRQHSVETVALTKSFGWTDADAFQQHDVQELCRVLFDALEDTFKGTVNAKLVDDLYQGQVKDYVQCRECKNETSRLDSFLDISLVIRPFGQNTLMQSVEEALEFYLKPELLDGDNQYKCEKCEKKVDAIKGLKFAKVPPLLALQLKRFDFDYNTFQRIKLNSEVRFPKYLDMNSYISGSGEDGRSRGAVARKMSEEKQKLEKGSSQSEDKGESESRKSLSAVAEDDIALISPPGSEINLKKLEADKYWGTGVTRDAYVKSTKTGPHLYELFSVLVHSGSALGGHYYAYIKDLDEDKWHNFNDSSVSTITEEEVRRAWGGVSNNYRGYGGAYTSSANAYMLMYRRISPENQSAPGEDEIPEHIRELVRAEEERKKRALEEKARRENQLSLKVYYKEEEKTVLAQKTDTVRAFKESAWRSFGVDGSKPLSPQKIKEVKESKRQRSQGDASEVRLEDVRLRLYQPRSRMMQEAFDEKEDKTLGELQYIQHRFLCLETKQPGESWTPYDPEAVNLNLILLNPKTNKFEPAISRQFPKNTTLRELREEASKIFGRPGLGLRFVRLESTSWMRRSYVLRGERALLKDDLRLNGDLYVECREQSDDDLQENGDGEQQSSDAVEKAKEALDNIITVRFNKPGEKEYDQEVIVDRRDSFAVLKKLIAEVIGLLTDEFKVKRASSYGQEIKEDTLQIKAFTQMDQTVHIERGRPLRLGEFNIKFAIYRPKDLDLSAYFSLTEENEEQKAGSDTKMEEAEEEQTAKRLADWVRVNDPMEVEGDCDPASPAKAVQVAGGQCALRKPISSLIVDTSVHSDEIEQLTTLVISKSSKIDGIRTTVMEKLKEAGKLPKDASPRRVRLREVLGSRMSKIYVDGTTMDQAGPQVLYEGRTVGVQVLPREEKLNSGEVIICCQWFNRESWTLGKKIEVNIGQQPGYAKQSLIEQASWLERLGEKLAAIYGVESLRDLQVLLVPSYQTIKVSQLPCHSWLDFSDASDLYRRAMPSSGDLLVVQDGSVPLKQLSPAEKAKITMAAATTPAYGPYGASTRFSREKGLKIRTKKKTEDPKKEKESGGDKEDSDDSTGAAVDAFDLFGDDPDDDQPAPMASNAAYKEAEGIDVLEV